MKKIQDKLSQYRERSRSRSRSADARQNILEEERAKKADLKKIEKLVKKSMKQKQKDDKKLKKQNKKEKKDKEKMERKARKKEVKKKERSFFHKMIKPFPSYSEVNSYVNDDPNIHTTDTMLSQSLGSMELESLPDDNQPGPSSRLVKLSDLIFSDPEDEEDSDESEDEQDEKKTPDSLAPFSSYHDFKPWQKRDDDDDQPPHPPSMGAVQVNFFFYEPGPNQPPQIGDIKLNMSDLFAGITTSIKSTANAITRNEYVRKVTESMNDAIMNYPKAMMDVREATNEDPWGPTGPQMKKIAEYTRSRYMEDFYNVYTPLFSRMLENNKDAWRRVYKSLILLDYLLKNGSERFVQESREKVYELRRLENYKYIDEKGKDQGINIRHRVKQILEMLNDDDILQAERKKANSDDKSKYRGYDQYDIKMGGNSFKSSSSSSNFDNNWDRGSSSTTSKRYDDDFKSKEVSNFSFNSNANRSPSPELGFVDETKKRNDDDDGFGDFVSSRSSQPASTNKSKPNNSAQSFFDDPVPVIPPPSGAAANYTAPPLSPVTKKASNNLDLLFDISAPAPAAAVSPIRQDDLFAQLNAPVTNAAPAPVAQQSSGMDLFDFGNAPMTQPTPAAAPMQAAPTNGAFNGFDFGSSFGSSTPTPAFGGAPSLQPMCAKPQQPSANNKMDLGGPSPKVGNSFAGLDQFMSLSLGSTNANAPKAKTLNQMMGGNQ